MKILLVLFLTFTTSLFLSGQPQNQEVTIESYFAPAKWRCIGPFRGGRSVTASGVIGDPLTYYMGITGGGVWKTSDAGQRWKNISDGYFKTGSVGAIAVAPSDPNVLYAGMGEHAVRGVMSSYGDGVYKSTDAGKTWSHLGLQLTRQIAGITIHPLNPDIVYVAAQGATYGETEERGVYKSVDGGKSWTQVLYVNKTTGCAHLIMDPNNPRILYAAMWDHKRYPWQVVSGGSGSGIYKSTDNGVTWDILTKGLPDELGKIGLAISAANSEKIYALIESDTEKEKGGLFVSEDSGDKWTRVSKDHNLVQRAWYYIEVFADPLDENTVYVLNAPALKSIDGGKSWSRITGTHGDYHDLWINPVNSKNMVIANDGGAAISFNGGKSWSTQDNMPTAQFYRVNVDNSFPYRVYGGQQDNSSVRIENRNIRGGGGISERNWTFSAGGESAFIAFDPDDPRYVMGGSYQGAISLLDSDNAESNRIMASPHQYLAMEPKDMTYRFNWNAPIIWSQHEANTFYHGAHVLLKTQDMGHSWTEVSGDLTRNDTTKQGKGGVPYTNEGAGGENYGTLSYVKESPHAPGVIWTGSDDGLVYLTIDAGKSWSNVTPSGLKECLVNAIELSPHDPGTAYIATTRYKFNDLTPSIYKTSNYGRNWTKITNGIPEGSVTRVVREDPVRKNLLFAGTETGMFISYDGGGKWQSVNLNLPVVPITDIIIKHDDIIAATQGRSFWIFDDLELLRQYGRTEAAVKLYTPAPAIRGAGGGPLDSNNDKFKGLSEFTGVNPAGGIVFYYELPESADSMHIKLSIIASDGTKVRQYSSEKDPDRVSYQGAPGADPLLSNKPGLNRMVWNLRHENLQDAHHAYLEGSYRGPRAVPGIYDVFLTIEGQEFKTKCTILPHPNIDASPEDYERQYQFMRELAQAVNEIHDSVNELQKIKTRIGHINKRLESAEEHKTLLSSGKDLIEKIDEWDGLLIQRKSEVYDDVINFTNGLTADHLFLKGQADSNRPFITQAMRDRMMELNQKWAPLQSIYNNLMNNEIKTYQENLSEAGVGLLK